MTNETLIRNVLDKISKEHFKTDYQKLLKNMGESNDKLEDGLSSFVTKLYTSNRDKLPLQANHSLTLIYESLIKGKSLDTFVLESYLNGKSSLSLVHKYRPQTLKEVVGQKLTTTTLINSIKQERLHSAYLFAGSRGTGKTSTARVLAKSLNCETGVTVEPCGVCRTCRDIQAGVSFGIYEIDCATNNGVDHARELVSKVCFTGYSRYKVYILDEAHNLTKQAFDALLKTLEEPGVKVVFILVTTELTKVPKTIQSRCQTFNFTPLKDYELKSYCQQILAKEGHSISPELLSLMISYGDGILRDTLTLLDKVILSEAKTEDDLLELLGIVPSVNIIQLLNAVSNQDYTEMFKQLKEINKSGIDTTQLLGEISNFVRNAIASHKGDLNFSIMTCDSKTYKAASNWGRKFPINKLVASQIILRDAQIDFNSAKFPILFLESTLLKVSEVLTAN